MPQKNKKLLTMKKVADILNISNSFAYQLGRQGQLPIVRLGRSVRVRESDLTKFINTKSVNEDTNVKGK